jgi:hypothetical protein
MAVNQANVALLTQDPNLVPQTVTVLAGGGPSSQRPTTPATWFHYYDTDLNRDVIWNGASWIQTSAGPVGPQGPQGFQGPAALFGPTLMRPSNPAPFQRYFDTDINAEIWWERGAWRTVAGTVSDVKVVTAANLATALANNPGWIQETNFPSAKQETLYFQPEQVQQIVYTGSPGWIGYDLTAQLNANNLSGCTAVLLMLKAELNAVGFGGPVGYAVNMSVASVSNGSSETAICATAMATRDDSNTSASDKTLAYVPIVEANNFYYRLSWANVPTPRGAVWLAGFVYNPLTHPTTITSFALRKT